MNITEVSVQQLMLQNLANPDYSPERLMCPASIEHNNSKRHRLYALLAGATNVFRPQRDHDLVESALRQGVTCLDVTPMHAAGLVARADAGRLGGIKVRVSGSSMSADLREGVLSRVTRNLEVRYGATECGTIAIAQVRSGDAETVGLPAPGVRFEIVDDSGRVLPTGEIGSIRIRTQGMSLGYYDNPRQTAHRFRDGWFWPGDVGRLLEDGRLVIEGRADDMMILNGVNIFPAEIERVLERHPAVAAAAAVAMSSRVHGQIPVAAVELRDGTTVTEAELRVFARERLALRSPRRVMILPSLPRNDQGKILRRKIADAFY